jgi:hypothetical protein
MKLNIKNFELKKDFDRIKILFVSHGVFVGIGHLMELYHNKRDFSSTLISVLIFSLLYYGIYRTRRSLFYSYWTLLGILFFTIFYRFCSSFFGDHSGGISYSYFLALCLMGLEAHILFSPIFYPIFNWWEYDFRYRDDLKVDVEDEEKNVTEGRLTDLRKEAGCISSFQNFKTGNVLHIKTRDNQKEQHFKVEVMSRRPYSLGRPVNYGVKFLLQNQEEKNTFSRFTKFWKSERTAKKKLKLEQET